MRRLGITGVSIFGGAALEAAMTVFLAC